MKKSLLLLTVSIILFACTSGSADKKVPELADQMCSCFDSYIQNTTPEEMKVYKAVSVAEHPQEVLHTAIAKMDAAQAEAFITKIKSVGDKNANVYVCLQGFDKKHEKETTKDKTALTEKLLAQLQANNCIIGAAMVNLGLKKGSKQMAAEK